jgi:hypothetical protein
MFNPCDGTPSPPYDQWCDSAIGPLRDVTANWRYYQPALVQPIPMVDYCPNEPSCSNGDPEDQPPPPPGTPLILAGGRCGTETAHDPTSGPPIPASSEYDSLALAAAQIPGWSALAPPGKNHTQYLTSKYCALRYVADDFFPLCTGCHRILIDFAAIPSGAYNFTSPASDGHWAARFTTDSSFSAMTPFNGHSPNVKNLCSDKQFNPAPGATCTQGLSQFDTFSHALEGDSAIYHHFPYEGRYFNGPSYLASDSPASFHWINGAYFDVDPAGATSLPVWYSAGYRGQGDAAGDTDWSYGCACEVPAFLLTDTAIGMTQQGHPPVSSGHTTWSPSLALQAAAGPPSSPSAGPGPSVGNGSGGGSPNTSPARNPVVIGLLLVLLLAALLAASRERLAS